MSTKTKQAYGGKPPHNDQRTSIEAALKAVDFQASMQDQVLALLKAHPSGLCDFEIEAALNAKHTTISARRRELVLEGIAVDSGKVRKTPSGCNAIVWRARRKNEQLSIDAPSQLDVIRGKLRKLIGRLETRDQLDAVWSATKAVLEVDAEEDS